MCSLSEINSRIKLKDAESSKDDSSTKVFDEYNKDYQMSCSNDVKLVAGEVSGDGGYNCDLCNKQFKYKCLLKRHKMIHSGSKPYPCKKCHKTFSRKYGLQRHAKIHSRSKSLICKRCHKKFSWKKDLKAHAQSCLRSLRHNLRCHVCSVTFVRKDSFEDHLLTECGTKPLSCEVCGKKYISTLYLERHKLSHRDENTFYHLYGCCTWESELKLSTSYPSVICSYVLENSIVKAEELDIDIFSEAEIATVTLEESNEPVEKCILPNAENPTVKLEESNEFIEKYVLSKAENPTVKMEEHDGHIESDTLPWTRNETNTSRDLLNREGDNRIDCHGNEGDYTFEIILPSTIVNKHDQRIEQHPTDVETRHFCKICDKEFKCKSLLDRHSKIHDVKSFSCDKCQKKFLRKEYLRRHKCPCTKPKRSCDVCNLTFVRKDSLEDHVLTKCGTKPLRCEICGMKYVSTLYLERHQLNHIGVLFP